MATLWLAATVERNRKTFYASIDNTNFYRLRKGEEDLYVILHMVSEQPNGRAWKSRRKIAVEPCATFSEPLKL